MFDWSIAIVPALSGLAAFVGAMAGIRVDVGWIKKELTRHDRELGRIRKFLKLP